MPKSNRRVSVSGSVSRLARQAKARNGKGRQARNRLKRATKDPNAPASAKQLCFLINLGWRGDTSSLTIADAKILIDDRLRKRENDKRVVSPDLRGCEIGHGSDLCAGSVDSRELPGGRVIQCCTRCHEAAYRAAGKD